MQYRVFISYAKEDFEAASKLFADLKEQSQLEPWLDKEFLLPGTEWEPAIMEALRSSHFFVLLLSRHSLTKTGFVQKEIKAALDNLEKFPPGSIFFIPARLDESAPLDPRLKKLQYVDMFPKWSTGVERVLAAIAFQRNKDRIKTIPASATLARIIDAKRPPMWRRLSRAMVIEAAKTRTSLAGANLMNADLTNLDLSGMDMRGANLVAANLKRTVLSKASLAGANCERAILDDALIDNADFWGVNFWGASVAHARTWKNVSSLEHANFFMTMGILPADMKYIRSRTTCDHGDYGAYLVYFESSVGMTDTEINDTFTWVRHEYFKNILGRTDQHAEQGGGHVR